MALIKCPECGRENVSDSAEMCPNCGYGIKAHFDKIKREEQQRKVEEARKKAEIEVKKREEDRIKSVPQLEKPQLTAPIVTLVIAVICLCLGVLQLGVLGSAVAGGLFLIIGSGLLSYGFSLFSKRIGIYELSKTNLEEYQRQVIREQDEEIAANQAAAVARAIKPECPYCHSHNTTKITTTAKAVNTAMFGILGQKRKYQWHCNKCKSDF